MQLAILLVVVCSVSPAVALGLTQEQASARLCEALAWLSIAPLACVAANGMLKQRVGRSTSPGDAQRQLERWQMILTWLWAGSSLAAIHLAQLPDVVRSVDAAHKWPLLDELLILAPPMISLFLVWTAFYFLEQQGRPQTNAEATAASLRQYLELRVRHHLGLTLLPALLVLGLQEAAAKMEWSPAGDTQQAWWLWAGLMGLLVLALPLALSRLWRTQRVADSPLKQRLMASCRALGCPVRDIVVWRTGGTVANAAVAGLVPRLRTIFLSDALLAQLSDDEVDVVVRHEAAHLAKHHLWQRLALLALPVLIYAAVQAQFPAATAALQAALSSAGISAALQASLLVPLAALGYAILAVGWLARLHEHDADLAACLAPAHPKPALLRSANAAAVDPDAVAHLHSALRKVLGGSDEFCRRRWLHPSGRQRVSFLEQLAERPALAASFRGRLLRISGFLVAACLAAAAAGCWPQ